MNELITLLTEALAKLKDRVDAIVMPESIKGDQGDKGDKGDKGDTGDAGKDGSDGKDGERGADGKDGIDGKDGLDGRDGLDGKNGQDGKDGQDGRDGKDGIDGKNGVDGLSIKGDKGDKPNHQWKGTKLKFELPNGEWGKEVDLAGKDGIGRYFGGSTGVKNITSANNTVQITQDGTTFDLSVSTTTGSATDNVFVTVRNNTGATLTKGTVVYINGAIGQNSTVAKALATSDATSAQTLGLVTVNLPNNTVGKVTIIGLVDDINTSAFTDGQQLYLSPTVAGGFTATKPHAPNHIVYVGVVEYAHPVHGKIFVKVQNGYELDEIHDVLIQSPANNDVLTYDAATDLWKNRPVTITEPINPVFTYTSGLLTSIAYGGGESKTFTYTSGLLTRLDFTKNGVTIRKTFNYTSGILTSITQVTL